MNLTLSPVQHSVKSIRFIRRGEVVNLGNVPPARTLLELLREDLGLTGTKEGCGEGDCGACTVVLGQIEDGALRFRAINSCIRLAHSIDGMALWTVEDLAAPDGSLHPAQQAMVQCHASQCGFCTPGFVMSLFGMYQNHVAPTLGAACASLPPKGGQRLRSAEAGAVAPTLAPAGEDQPITRALAQEELSGNLCRCTGYRPILDAAQHMARLPPAFVDASELLSKLELLGHASHAQEADLAYKLPQTLAALLRLRAAHPKAQLVAGCTDVGLWVTKQHRQFDQVIDLTQVAELRRIEHPAGHVLIGAAVTLADAFAALVTDRPQLHPFASRFAGLPVRNSGTLGGNIANGSPIGDSMPLLIALRASVVLMRESGQRELPLEALYTGYRQNVMAADEVLAFVRVPKPGSPHPHPLPLGEGVQAETGHPMQPDPLASSPLAGAGRPEFLRVYKISKRYDDDISAVCLAINLHIAQGVVAGASIGAGGVAATPARAVQTEAFLTGQPWTLATVRQAMAVLRAEFSPIADMRASGAYRREVLGNLLERYWLENRGLQQINLESFVLQERA
ncbi:xanthine dehydrogenase small subunit [Polaromonas sp. CG_9.11]|uniref:xanthine dehydrogenase small subunit n=1 Tax=Polaromonas sp. CG_9.11 TaxID=2787730 RepID=UPI0018C99E93|nr:FAD binding domain-containing protein [Polaromonas sp. CG_9.11]MBG6075257.1 xanthine dehydrogenase small subunit [Polaromonas sp. CG_9.11]